MRFFNTLLALATLPLLLGSPTVSARDCGGSCNASNASAVMSEGLGQVVTGSLSAVAASGQVVIESVQQLDDALLLVVKTAAVVGKASVETSATVGKASVKLSGKAVKKLSLVAGQALEISVVSTGYFLVASGKAIAFIPNEVGQALLNHEKVKP